MALFTYGFLLLFPLWAPYPSLSQLNTSYGDFTLWKLYIISLGTSPFYAFFLGLVEVITGLLLLYRKAVPFAANRPHLPGQCIYIQYYL